MITIHRWSCSACYKAGKQWRWYLNVNDEVTRDNERLLKFETAISKHVAKFGHEIIHRESVEGKIRRI